MIDVAKDFYPRLANRDKNQGDGKHTAIEFRRKYLSDLDSQAFWKLPTKVVKFDFSGVRKIGPSFANEAFAYFTRYASPEEILQVISIANASEVQLAIIKNELEAGRDDR